MSWEVKNVTDEEVWTREYIREIVAARPKLPPRIQMFGKTRASWFETEPGVAHISTVGGEFADRAFAEQLLRERLKLCNIRQAQYTVHRMQKVADWNDIMAKATRLIQDGQATLLRNGAQNIVGHVIGDTGEYQTEISREDPNSMAMTQWQCDCDWDQFAWQRTRQWKKYEGRPCSHVLATWWLSQSTPLDEEMIPGQGDQGALFDPGTGQAPPAPPRPAPAPAAPPAQQLSIPGVTPPQAPPGAEIIPPMPGQEPQPVSVPGGRVPSPADPLQHPGGTFSKVAADDWNFWQDDIKPGGWKWIWDEDTQQGTYGDDSSYHWTLRKELGTDNTHGGTIRPDGLINFWNGYQRQDMTPALAEWFKTFAPNAYEPTTPEQKQEAYDYAMKIAAAEDKFQNSDMVRLNVEEYGIAQGKSEEHGAGQYQPIPKNSIGEVMGQDPTTGWVYVNFPLHDTGPMEPFSVAAWIEPEKLTPMPKVKKPGPFIKRR